jgi:hypothetical protein
MMPGMVIDMDDEQLQTLAELQAFLDGTVTVDFALAAGARYDFISRTVRRFGYGRPKRADKAVVLRLPVTSELPGVGSITPEPSGATAKTS